MCWKDEWAKAINNLNSVITHVEYAQKKLEARLARNQKHLSRLKGDKKYNYPLVLAPVEERILRNTEAIENCKSMVSEFRESQGLLYCMVHTIGITRSKMSKMSMTQPQRVYNLMGNYPGKKVDCNTTDCESCPLT